MVADVRATRAGTAEATAGSRVAFAGVCHLGGPSSNPFACPRRTTFADGDEVWTVALPTSAASAISRGWRRGIPADLALNSPCRRSA